MATIKDVAKRAGVSVSAVSKALNDYSDISEATKQRIYKAIEELNYIPNLAAQQLSSSQRKTVGLILDGFESSDGIDGILYQIMRGVYLTAEKHGFEVISIHRKIHDQAHSYEQICQAYKLAGLIVQGVDSQESAAMIHEAIVSPTVFISDEAVDQGLSGSIISNNVAIAECAMDYLVAMGHKDILFLNGKNEGTVSTYREQGYKNAVKRHGLKHNKILYSQFQEDEAYAQVKAFFAQEQSVTAIFCASDLTAIGALNALKESGLRVPEDVSVIGVDGIILSDYTSPRLTTVKQNFFTMGEQAFLSVYKMIKTHQRSGIIEVPFSLEIKDSVQQITK